VAPSAYWKKVKSVGERQVIELDLQTPRSQIAVTAKVVGGTETREREEVADQV
jgi:hypothetical protein